MLSDDSSVDSDSGIRFKTESTRNKEETSASKSDGRSSGRDRRAGRPHSRDRENRNRRLISPRRRDSPRQLNPRKDRQHRHDRRHSPARRRSPVRARRESPRRQSPRRQSLKRESPRRHSLKRESPRRHSLKSESPRRQSLKRESPKRESLKRDSPRQHLKDSSRRNRHSSPRKDRLHSSTKPSLIRNHSPKKSTSPVKCSPPPRIIMDTTKDLRDKLKRKPSPIVQLDVDAEPQRTSYYNQVFEESTETINIDSSEDEMVLHSRLLALESVLSQTKERKKSKHKEKKHKKSKSKKSDKSDEESQKAEVVSSTTDIQVDLISPSVPDSKEAESSEEGEILSDESSVSPSDLRKLITWKKPPLPDSSLKNPDDSEAMAVSGPALPPHLEKKNKDNKNMSNGVEGPALPPHMKQGDSKGKSIGPALTEEMRKSLAKQPAEIPDVASSPSEASDAEDIGPLPEGLKHKWTKAHESLEERALAIKIGKIDSSSKSGVDVKSREEWMLELPSGKAKEIGLGPRQFRTREAPDMSDRSSWTDTPKEKALKAAGVLPEKEVTNSESLKAEAHRRYITERDEEQAQVIKKHKKKHNREESLLEQHEKKIKKKKKKEEKEAGGKIRRPFNRDIDLGVNRFDEAQKKSIIKKAQLLDTRFSSGESKFL